MTASSDTTLLVLQTLRLKSFLDADVVAIAARLSEQAVDDRLAHLSDKGWVAYRDGRIRGWSLTTAGRIEGERLLAAELDEAGCRAVVESAYREFLAQNAAFLTACTRWQIRHDDGLQVVNDHEDAVYDASVIAELDAIDDQVQPICEGLAEVLQRFGYYNGRFAVARVRVHQGDHEWFTAPMIDSYHTVWFELHENLLATLNRERADESH